MSVIVPGWRLRRSSPRVIHNPVHTSWVDSSRVSLPRQRPMGVPVGRCRVKENTRSRGDFTEGPDVLSPRP